MDDLLRRQPEFVILLGTLALLVAAAFLAALTGDGPAAARPKALPPPNVWEDFRYPVLLRSRPGAVGPQLPGVKPIGRFFSLWGMSLSCAAEYASRFTGSLQRIRR
jgi:hypothetical protein